MAFFDKKGGARKRKTSVKTGGASRSKSLDSTQLARWEGALETREKVLKEKEKEVEKALEKTEQARKDFVEKLEKVASLSRQEAEKLLLEAVEKTSSEEIAKRIKKAEDEIKTNAQEKAKEVLVEAIRHGVTDWGSEYTVSTIRLPDEEIKGRIIGREGRNIRAFEQATGVEIELGEGLDLLISSFDPVRREIARLSLEKLIKDGRIQPGRIEEVVSSTKRRMDQILFEEGKKIAHAVKVYSLQPDLLKMLGRFKYRFSYGQNLAQHTIEETKIGVKLAYDLKADVATVRLGCLLHDIGKVITDDEGTHVELGVNLLKKYDLPKEVIACVAQHHEDKPFSSVESSIVWIADAASGSRPGARYEPHEEYVNRMESIEEAAKSFAGVKDAFAYQAGREVRVVVKPEEVSDSELTVLAKKIADKLEEEAKWVGQIKVVCIRETRVTETAQ